MRIVRYIPFIALAVLASCGGAAQSETREVEVEQRVEEVVVNRDSLIRVMDVRYNTLCAERKAAFEERDAQRRAELIEANDRACAEFQDSLEQVLQMWRIE